MCVCKRAEYTYLSQAHRRISSSKPCPLTVLTRVAACLPFAAIIDRQRAVHEAIKEEMASIHALTLKCRTPAQDVAAAEAAAAPSS